MTQALEHRYTPRGAAARLFECRKKEVLLAGPAGTGKSLACLEKLHMAMLVNPGAKGLIVRRTLASLGGTALATWRKFVVTEALETGLVQFYGGSQEEPAQYRYFNRPGGGIGSVVVIGGMDMNKSLKVMSAEYDMIYVQEATELTVTDWEALTSRLRNWVISYQQLIADCNPSGPTHWLRMRADAGITTMMESRHEDNPAIFNEDGSMTERGAEYMSTLDNLTGVRYYRLRKGLWVAAEGVIYEDWDPAIHLIDRFEIPQDWQRYWGIDFGHTNPFVLQWWAVDPDGRMYLYREIYHTKKLLRELAKMALDQVTDDKGDWIEPRPYAIVADHDAQGRAEFQRDLGLGIAPAKKDVQTGIQRLQRRMKVAGDGRPRMFIMRDSLCHPRDQALVDAALPTCTVEEFAGYVWAVIPGRPPKEEPNKENDHGMDTARYVSMRVPEGAAPSTVRFV